MKAVLNAARSTFLKIKNFWYFLVLFLILFAGKNALAADYFNNFDLLASSTPLYSLPYWNGLPISSGIVSPLANYTFPNSFTSTTTSGTHFTDTNAIFSGSMYVLWGNDNDSNAINAQSYESGSAGNLFFITFASGGTYDNLTITGIASGTVILKGKNVLTKNIWYKVEYEVSGAERKMRMNWNSEGWTQWYTTTNPGQIYECKRVKLTQEGFYVDNFSINGATGFSEDYVIWDNPVYAAGETLNYYNLYSLPTQPYYFNWSVNFTISSSTKSEYLNNIVYIVIQYVNASSSVVNEVDLTDNEYFSAYSIDTIYNMNDASSWNLPSDLGIYTAVASLRAAGGFGDYAAPPGGYILASSTVQFYIGTSSPQTSSAWCTDLCPDLELTQGTTTPVWGISVPWLVPHFLNDGFCSVRYVGCYLFQQHQFSNDAINRAYTDFKAAFPFNTVFKISDTITAVFASSTISTTGSFGLPMIRKTGTTTQYYFMPLLTSTTTAAMIGSSNATIFRNSLTYLIYAAYAAAIFFIVW